MKPQTFHMRRGFTLIELLLVIGIIAILASIVIVAINPTKQLGDARDAQRRSDVNTILNAVYQYSIDNNGTLPGYLSGATQDTVYNICQASLETSDCGLPAGTLVQPNLDVLTGSYLVSIPQDPRAASGSLTGYTITRLSGNRIRVCAPHAEQQASDAICVTR